MSISAVSSHLALKLYDQNEDMKSTEELTSLTRKELQALAKLHGVKANKKSTELIEELSAIFQAENDSKLEGASDNAASDAIANESMHMSPGGANSSLRDTAAEEIAEKACPTTSLSYSEDLEAATSFVISPIKRVSTPHSEEKLRSSLPYPYSSEATPVETSEHDVQDMDDSVTSFQERSFRNLTMNIDQFGRASISSPFNLSDQEKSPRVTNSDKARRSGSAKHLAVNSERAPEDPGCRKVQKNNLNIVTVDLLNKLIYQVKTPAKAHPALVPKSNKAQRLRREALEKKRQRIDTMIPKVLRKRFFFSIDG